MKATVRFLLLGVWIVGATLIAARLWLTHPDAIPRFPESFWLWLIAVSGSKNGEDLGNLELLVALALSFLFVITVTVITGFLWRRRPGR